MEWARAVHAIGLKTPKEHRFLLANKELHIKELMEAEIPQSALMYNGVGAVSGAHAHCMHSSALMLLVLLVSSIRQLAAPVKQNALSLAIGLLQVGVKTLHQSESCLGMVYVKGQGYIHQTLEVDSNGIVHGLFKLIQQHPGMAWAWAHLMKTCLCSHTITSSVSLPTLWDLLILLLWAKCNPTQRNVWKYAGQLLWPKCLWLCGRVLDALALERSTKPLEQLPLLKTAKGRSKRVPWQNKVMLLRKVRQIKHHRKNTMESHSDLVPKGSGLVTAEQRLTTALYAHKLKCAYEEAFHFSIHWDPSDYDTETMVSIIFSLQAGGKGTEGLAAYLPIQNIRPVAKKEVDPEIQALGAKSKLTRIDGFAEIRAVSHSLQAVGMPLEKFFLDKNVLWRPLQEFESRMFEGGRWWIVNSRTGSKAVQLPENFSIAKTPLLISISDQGGINRSGLDYLTSKLGMTLHVGYDPYHRSWNDVKLSLKASKGDLFKCVLSYSLFFNINYGPFGSKSWHEKKKQKARELLESGSAHAEPFLSFIPWICLERQIKEPTTPAERETLFSELSGPSCKVNAFFFFFPVRKVVPWRGMGNKTIDA